MAKTTAKTTATSMATSTSKEKQAAFDNALAQINKQFGKGAILKLGDSDMEVESISTGSLAIDRAVGNGGLPKGRIIEIYGPESSGKTLFCLEVAKQVQMEGGNVAFVDAEHAFNAEWAAAVGVDVDNLAFSQPDNGEQALEIVDMLLRSGGVSLIIVDSVSALTPQREIDGEMGDSHVGLQARLMSQALRKINASISKTGTIVIFINQLREKIGVFFGSPETTTGGKALKFYASIRIDIRTVTQLKEGSNPDPYGKRTRIKVVKNKVGPPLKQAEFDILFTPGNEGYSMESDLRDIAIETGIFEKNSSWIKYKGENIAHGDENARLYLKNNPEIAKSIRTTILEADAAKKKAAREEAAKRKAEASVDSVDSVEFPEAE